VRELLYLHHHTPPNNRGEKWFEQDEGDARLAEDRRLVRSRYPDLYYGFNIRQKFVFIDGRIILKEAMTGVPTEIKLRIQFHDQYPDVEPVALDRSNLFPQISDRHFCKGGVCCLWLPPETKWQGSKKDAILTFVDHVAVFFERQLIYDATDGESWPWGERGHNVQGYIDYIHDRISVGTEAFKAFVPLLAGGDLAKDARCPCQNGKRYRFCHRKIIIELRKYSHILERSESDDK
jgi:hypothetical protein